MKSNIVFIAQSLDGFIADKAGGLDWLYAIPNPDQLDMGYNRLMERVDALIMGRKTFETICNFDCDWPYAKPVFVLSTTLQSIPDPYLDKAYLLKGTIPQVLAIVHERGYHRLYIDGGSTIQGFLKEDLIDELIVTTMPILLGGGSRLFGDLPLPLEFDLKHSETFLSQVLQCTYHRKL